MSTSTSKRLVPAPFREVVENLRLVDNHGYIRITWVDYINFVRHRVVPVQRVLKFIEKQPEGSSFSPGTPQVSLEEDDLKVITNPRGGVSLTKACLGLVFLTLPEGFGPTGEYLYVPDPNSAIPLWHADHQASVMGWFEEKECSYARAAQGYQSNVNRDSALLFRSPLCPRYTLERILLDAEKEGTTFLVGFESEVIFLSSVDPIKAVNDYSWSVSQALPTGAVETRAVEEIAQVLNKSGLLEMYHAEAAPGQYEFITTPDRPLQAVDALIFTRETIRNIASKHGLHATFAPRIYLDNCGSAAHVHMSLKSTNSSHNTPSSNPALSRLNASFLQGLLTHLSATYIFTLPTTYSYVRAVDGVWSGGTYVAWGRDNRETPVRLCGIGADDPNLNFEVKCVDATANPYLAVAALLSAGLDGVRKGMELTVGKCQVPASLMTVEERKSKGVDIRLPLNVEEARAALLANEVIRKAMGEELVEKFLATNKTLAEQLDASSFEEAMKKLVKVY